MAPQVRLIMALGKALVGKTGKLASAVKGLVKATPKTTTAPQAASSIFAESGRRSSAIMQKYSNISYEQGLQYYNLIKYLPKNVAEALRDPAIAGARINLLHGRTVVDKVFKKGYFSREIYDPINGTLRKSINITPKQIVSNFPAPNSGAVDKMAKELANNPNQRLPKGFLEEKSTTVVRGDVGREWTKVSSKTLAATVDNSGYRRPDWPMAIKQNSSTVTYNGDKRPISSILDEQYTPLVKDMAEPYYQRTFTDFASKRVAKYDVNANGMMAESPSEIRVLK